MKDDRYHAIVLIYTQFFQLLICLYSLSEPTAKPNPSSPFKLWHSCNTHKQKPNMQNFDTKLCVIATWQLRGMGGIGKLLLFQTAAQTRDSLLQYWETEMVKINLIIKWCAYIALIFSIPGTSWFKFQFLLALDFDSNCDLSSDWTFESGWNFWRQNHSLL